MPHSQAWAEMLANAAKTHTRLARAMGRAESMRSGTLLLEELEKQRTRVARDLHSGAGQPLAGIRLNLELMAPWAETAPEEVRVAMARLVTLTDSALEQIRSVAHRFHPPSWQHVSLVSALRTLLSNSGVDLRFPKTVVEISPLSHEPPLTSRIAVYRCAQECIANSIRHSEATTFSFALREAPPWLELTISDDGKGLPPNADRAAGIGLRAIREHAQAAGGGSHIFESSARNAGQRGTTVVVRVPLEV
jgi:two-component system sensor histidine kinase UhpB